MYQNFFTIFLAFVLFNRDEWVPNRYHQQNNINNNPSSIHRRGNSGSNASPRLSSAEIPNHDNGLLSAEQTEQIHSGQWGKVSINQGSGWGDNNSSSSTANASTGTEAWGSGTVSSGQPSRYAKVSKSSLDFKNMQNLFKILYLFNFYMTFWFIF